jgi:hypothetical protein
MLATVVWRSKNGKVEMTLEKVLKWMKALTIPVLLVAVTIAFFAKLANTTEWSLAVGGLLAYWLGPKAYKAIKAKKKNENLD